MKVIDDMYAMRYRIRVYEHRVDTLHSKVYTEIRFTAELICDDDLKELMKHMTDIILNLDTHCEYAECDVSDPLDWEKGDVWRKAQYIWTDKMWKPGKDLVRTRGDASVCTQAMIALYDEDAGTAKIWDMIAKKAHDPRDVASLLVNDDVNEMIRMTSPRLIAKLAEIGSYSCDWVAVARHIKEKR